MTKQVIKDTVGLLIAAPIFTAAFYICAALMGAMK
jgi:hypothetical protein